VRKRGGQETIQDGLKRRAVTSLAIGQRTESRTRISEVGFPGPCALQEVGCAPTGPLYLFLCDKKPILLIAAAFLLNQRPCQYVGLQYTAM
jgi:hypothetical protein